MKLKSAIIPLTAAIGLAFAGAAYSQEVVKIAHVGPLSGPNAHMGKDNEIVCPYCSTHYVFNSKLAAGTANPLSAIFHADAA